MNSVSWKIELITMLATVAEFSTRDLWIPIGVKKVSVFSSEESRI